MKFYNLQNKLTTIGILFMHLPFLMVTAESQKFPDFLLRDQFGNTVQSKDFRGKRLILAGCYPKDEAICRKVGRKIYWTLETLIIKENIQIERIGYISLKNISESQIAKILPRFHKVGFESVFLDRKGELETGLKSGMVYIRGFNKSGILVFEEYRSSISSEDINNLFTMISR